MFSATMEYPHCHHHQVVDHALITSSEVAVGDSDLPLIPRRGGSCLRYGSPHTLLRDHLRSICVQGCIFRRFHLFGMDGYKRRK